MKSKFLKLTVLIKHCCFYLMFALLLQLPLLVMAQAGRIEINTVSVLPNSDILIDYKVIDATYSDIYVLNVRYWEDISSPNDYIEIEIADPFTGEITLSGEHDLDGYSKQRTFVLLANFSDGNPFTPGSYHSNIYLHAVNSEFSDCEPAVRMEWMNYAKYRSLGSLPEILPFDRFEILVSEYDGSTASCNVSVEEMVFKGAQEMWDSQADFRLPPDVISPGNQYCFRIRSYDSRDPDLESYSNIVRIEEFLVPPVPTTPHITGVSINNNKFVEISIDVDDFGFGQFEYTIKRSKDLNGPFDEIDKIVDHSLFQITYFDNTADSFNEHPWFYIIVADREDCPMDEPPESLIESSIFLEGGLVDDPAGRPDFFIVIEWEHAQTNNTYEYTLWRIMDESEDDIPLSTNSSGTFRDVIDKEYSGQSVRYLIRASDANNGLTIESNHINVPLAITMQDLPNAFRPSSSIPENKIFKPDFGGIDPEWFEMRIYDRNGLLVFKTIIHEDGWDGTLNGGDAPMGTYGYVIRYRDHNGTPHEKQGVVHLVR